MLREGAEDAEGAEVAEADAHTTNKKFMRLQDDLSATQEQIDPAASAASIKAGGRAVGYGVGVTGTMAEFNENRRSQAKKETGAGLSIGAWSAPRSRLSKKQKKEAEVCVAASA